MRYRFKEKEIIYELIEPPQNKNFKKGVIVFPGLPNQPRNDDFGDNLASEGLYVLQPRYIGSWESYGQFSLNNCLKTIIEAEKFFMRGEAAECWANKNIKWNIDEIVILSSSFGSSIVLSALEKIKTKRIICLCPLTDLFKHNSIKTEPEQDLKVLGDFMVSGFENAFRGFNLPEWAEFIKGNSKVNPIAHTSKIKNKEILLIHGDKDDVVHFSRTQEFYNQIKNKNTAEIKIYPGIGHGKKLRDVSLSFIVDRIKNEAN